MSSIREPAPSPTPRPRSYPRIHGAAASGSRSPPGSLYSAPRTLGPPLPPSLNAVSTRGQQRRPGRTAGSSDPYSPLDPPPHPGGPRRCRQRGLRAPGDGSVKQPPIASNRRLSKEPRTWGGWRQPTGRAQAGQPQPRAGAAVTIPRLALPSPAPPGRGQGPQRRQGPRPVLRRRPRNCARGPRHSPEKHHGRARRAEDADRKPQALPPSGQGRRRRARPAGNPGRRGLGQPAPARAERLGLQNAEGVSCRERGVIHQAIPKAADRPRPAAGGPAWDNLTDTGYPRELTAQRPPS
ncbi:basic salivary proline-rich protein 2-like [Peromyscus leucopus]|uniref:basic salivary proline-rich protein 2-like n=1 Tax=Peromyscus leucopus TaxID=10041 RepID=UPI0010A16DCC|nr:basic salivary proline-rich protein 2-like [Peromyscus leucopus]